MADNWAVIMPSSGGMWADRCWAADKLRAKFESKHEELLERATGKNYEALRKQAEELAAPLPPIDWNEEGMRAALGLGPDLAAELSQVEGEG